MAELSGDAPAEDTGAGAGDDAGDASAPPPPPPSGGGGGGNYADEVHSVTIHARQRTFYIDLKESNNGKFFKVSEKSRGGRKTTIMFDAEDLEQFIAAFAEMKDKI